MFKYIDRKEKNHIIVLPGWAFDHRIFETLDLPYNYFLYHNHSITNLGNGIRQILRDNNIDKISFFGWSQGAFTACNFASKNPEIVEEIILVSLREKYKNEELGDTKRHLIRNKRAYLYKFYKDCFCKEEANNYLKIRKTLLEEYMDKMSSKELIKSLEWLSKAEIKPELLAKIRHIKIVHGSNDLIAPIGEAIDVAHSLPQSKLIIFEQTGHLPFLRKDFKKCLYE